MDKDEKRLKLSAVHAIMPWFSPDAEPEYTFITDPPELMEKCFHCTEADCVDCIAHFKQEKQGRPIKVDLAFFAEMLFSGLSCKQVCSKLGIGKATFYNYKKLILKGATA